MYRYKYLNIQLRATAWRLVEKRFNLKINLKIFDYIIERSKCVQFCL